jgi:hypothetical protein
VFNDAATHALLRGAIEKYGGEDAIPSTIKGLYDIRFERVKKIKDAAMRFKDPEMPMSVAMK